MAIELNKLKYVVLDICWRCSGAGEVYPGRDEHDQPTGPLFTCPECKGSGKVITQEIWSIKSEGGN